jgi:hypothetical protein
MGVVSAEWLQTELPMHEYDCISCFEKVFRRSCTTGA